MPCLVRPVTPADHPALIEQFLALNQHEAEIVSDRRTDREAAELALPAALRLAAECGGHALVAELDRRVVGHAFVLYRRDGVYVRTALRDYAYLSELYVRPEVRRQGVARALMDRAEALARARGVRRLVLSVLAGNDVAEPFYAALGYRPYVIDLQKVFGED
jgi:GNAT superfamily N-acetyltransferase